MERHGFKSLKVLGRGSYGEAVLVEGVGKERRVIKFINLEDLTDEESKRATNEITILQQLAHPNIVKYYDSFSEAGKLYIVMEYAESGTLQSLLDTFHQRGTTLTEPRLLQYFVQLCLALQHVHGLKIVHRDLSALNVFLTDNKQAVKLGDFGIATALRCTNGLMATRCGTPHYMSPELVMGRMYSSRSDIWALGCILYQLMACRHPFESKCLPSMVAKICVGEYPPPPSKYSRPLQNLLAMLLNVDAQKRPTIGQILNQPFVITFRDQNAIQGRSVPANGLEVFIVKKMRFKDSLDTISTATQEAVGAATVAAVIDGATPLVNEVQPIPNESSEEPVIVDLDGVTAYSSAFLTAIPSILCKDGTPMKHCTSSPSSTAQPASDCSMVEWEKRKQQLDSREQALAERERQLREKEDLFQATQQLTLRKSQRHVTIFTEQASQPAYPAPQPTIPSALSSTLGGKNLPKASVAASMPYTPASLTASAPVPLNQSEKGAPTTVHLPKADKAEEPLIHDNPGDIGYQRNGAPLGVKERTRLGIGPKCAASSTSSPSPQSVQDRAVHSKSRKAENSLHHGSQGGDERVAKHECVQSTGSPRERHAAAAAPANAVPRTSAAPVADNDRLKGAEQSGLLVPLLHPPGSKRRAWRRPVSEISMQRLDQEIQGALNKWQIPISAESMQLVEKQIARPGSRTMGSTTIHGSMGQSFLPDFTATIFTNTNQVGSQASMVVPSGSMDLKAQSNESPTPMKTERPHLGGPKPSAANAQNAPVPDPLSPPFIPTPQTITPPLLHPPLNGQMPETSDTGLPGQLDGHTGRQSRLGKKPSDGKPPVAKLTSAPSSIQSQASQAKSKPSKPPTASPCLPHHLPGLTKAQPCPEQRQVLRIDTETPQLQSGDNSKAVEAPKVSQPNINRTAGIANGQDHGHPLDGQGCKHPEPSTTRSVEQKQQLRRSKLQDLQARYGLLDAHKARMPQPSVRSSSAPHKPTPTNKCQQVQAPEVSAADQEPPKKHKSKFRVPNTLTFKLAGNVYLPPAVMATDPAHHQAEAMRVHLESILSQGTFMAMYNLLADAAADGSWPLAIQRCQQLVDASKQPYVDLVKQLVEFDFLGNVPDAKQRSRKPGLPIRHRRSPITML